MYWTNMNPNGPSIEAAWMDGTNRTILINSKLSKPTGLAIDFLGGERIYWCDQKENLIESMNPDGTDRARVVSSSKLL